MANTVRPPKMKPTVYLSLHGKDVDLVQDLEIGQIAVLTVRGKVIGLSKRKDSEGATGSIDLELPKIVSATKDKQPDTSPRSSALKG